MRFAWLMRVLFFLPLVLHLVGGATLARWRTGYTRRRRNTLLARQSLGGGFECRLCGGPLPTVDLDAPLVACPYCRAQNIPERLQSEFAARDEVLSFEQIAARARATARGSKWQTFAITVMWLFLPGLLGISVLLLMNRHDERMLAERRPMNRRHTYVARLPSAIVAIPGDPNLCIFDTTPGFSRKRFDPDRLNRERDEMGPPAPVDVTTLIGKTIVRADWLPYEDPPRRTLARITSDGWGHDWFETDRGERFEPDWTCLR